MRINLKTWGVCDDESNDGVETFDLGVQSVSILMGQSGTDNVISFHETQEDADSNQNSLPESYTNSQNPQTIYVRLENSSHPECYTTTSFQLMVNEQPVLLMDDQWPICEGEIVEVFADLGYDEYLWSTGDTTSSVTIDTPGTYEVTVANVYGDLRCEANKTITVVESGVATIVEIETVDWSLNDNVVSVMVEGNGDYEFSLDGITYQDSNVFTNVNVNETLVYVRDKNGCGTVTDEFYLLYYPKFFTPNSDGYHDTWQLYNAFHEPGNKVFVFDRYGKLLKQLSPHDAGWDGTFNGQHMPTSDYWFVVERMNGKQYRGHFTLKR